MSWSAHYAWRRVQLRFVRALARRGRGGLVRGVLSVSLAFGLAAAGAAWVREYPGAAFAWWPALEEGARLAVGRGSERLAEALIQGIDARSGIAMMESVLPAVAAGSGPEPHETWRTPARAWVHMAAGIDLSEPRSFLEHSLPGFLEAYRRHLDTVRLPGAGDDPRAAPGEAIGGGPGDAPDGAGGSASHDAAGSPGNGAGGLSGSAGAATPEAGRAGSGDFARSGGGETHGAQQPGIPAAPPAPPKPPARPGGAGAPAEGADAIPASLMQFAGRDWGDEPLVLILHSHTSESYRTIPPDPAANETNHVFNSSDTGITRVGEALAEKLRSRYNIPTIHTKRIHDWPQHVAAYRHARETVAEFLQRYPSIEIVLDLHRQGIRDYSFATRVDGIDTVAIDVIYTTAQTMPYGSHPNWRENRAFAERLAQAMEEVHAGLVRRTIRVDDSRYNQDLHPRMVLLEIGNYLDLEEHAVTAAKLLADAVALVLGEIVAERRVAGAATPRRSAVVPPPPRRPSPVARTAG